MFFGVFGRVTEWKGIKEFIHASAIVFKSFPNSKAFVVGDSSDSDGSYLSLMKSLAEELKCEEKIIFTGFRSDVPAMLALMDIIVHTSITPEPFGMGIIEGMATGKPIVATKSGGPVDIVDNYRSGILVEMGVVQEIADAILVLLRDEKAREKMGAEGLRRVKKYFTKEKHAQLIDAVYSQLLGKLE